MEHGWSLGEEDENEEKQRKREEDNLKIFY
jgi:hypothetical protein